jgi:hypothetical protein
MPNGPTISSIGAELSDIPFGDMIASVARGIADGQRQLDLASVKTLIELSQTTVQIIPEVAEVITPSPMQVNVSGHGPVTVTGARVSASAAEPVSMTALQAGITPTFYQFAEATIQLKLSMQVREVEEIDTNGTRNTRFLMFGSNVNFKTQNTYSYQVDGSASVNVTLRPVPVPQRLVPATVTVNTLGPQPVVTVNP